MQKKSQYTGKWVSMADVFRSAIAKTNGVAGPARAR
jgi:hypothetical protein